MQERVFRAAGLGAVLGAVYLGISVLAWTLRGHALGEIPPGAWRVLVGLYVGGGLVGGTIVGLIQPEIRNLYLAIAAFTVAAIPASIGANSLFFPVENMAYKDPIPRIVAIALFLGFIGGKVYWERQGSES